MKASELIKELEAVIEKYGDLPVIYTNRHDEHEDVFQAVACDALGNGKLPLGEEADFQPVEIYLH